MNEELLKKIYEKYGLSQKGTFEKFSQDMQNPEVQRKVYDKYGLSQKGPFEKFQSDLGYGAQQTTENAPTGLIDHVTNLVKDVKVEDLQNPVDPFVNAWKRGSNLSETSDIVAIDNEAPDATQLSEVARLQQEQQSLPSSPAYQKFSQAQTLGESLKALVENPLFVVGEIFAESTAGLAGGWEDITKRAAQGGAVGTAYGAAAGVAGGPLAPVTVPTGAGTGLVTGLSAGTVAGMAETSFKLEWAGKFLEVLQEAGVDTTNPESLAKAFADDNIMSKARELATKKAGVIAFFDLVSGGIAGKIVTKPAKSLLGKIGQGAAELGVQGALGGGGEAGSQLAAGEDINYSSIVAEVIGEGATAPVEIAAGATAYGKSRSQDPAIGEIESDLDSTGDIDLDLTVDEEYQKLAEKMDALDFGPDIKPEDIDKIAEDIGSDIEAWSTIDEENEIPDAEYTPEEAARIQATGPMPSSQEQELNLDDSERMSAVDALAEYERQESERLEFEDRYTPEELAQMSEEDAAPASVRRAKDKFEQKEAEKKAFAETPVEDKGAYTFTTPEKQAAPKEPTAPVAPPTVASTPTVEGDSGTYSFGKEEEKTPLEKRLEKRVKSFWEDLDAQPIEKLKEKLEEEQIDLASSEPGSQEGFEHNAKVSALNKAIARRETPKAPTKPRVKPQIDPEERKKDLIVKYTAQLDNIRKDKPNKRAKRLAILNEKTLDIPEVNDLVKRELQSLEALTDEREFAKALRERTPEEKLDLIGARVTDERAPEKVSLDRLKVKLTEPLPTDGPSAIKQLNELNAIVDEIKASGRLIQAEKSEVERIVRNLTKTIEPIAEEELIVQKVQEEAAKTEKRTQQQEKDSHLTAIAKATVINNPVAIQKAVDDYLAWRREKQLPTETKKGPNQIIPIDADYVKKQAAAEAYVTRAEKEIERDAERARAEERKRRTDKKGQEKRVRDQDEQKRLDDLARELGLDDDIEIDEMEGFPEELKVTSRGAVSNIQKVPAQELFKRMTSVYQGVIGGAYIAALERLVSWSNTVASKFYKNGLEIYLVDNLGIAKGISINSLNDNRKIIVIDRGWFGDTDAHELIHYIVRAIQAAIAIKKGVPQGAGKIINRYANPKDFQAYLAAGHDFYGKVDQIHSQALTQYRDTLTKIGRKFDNKQDLTQEDVNFLTALSLYLKSRGLHSYEMVTSSKQINELIDNTWNAQAKKMTYGLQDSDEMLAETFSNPFFMLLMSQFESKTTVNKTESVFQALINALKDLIGAVVKIVPFKQNNFVDLLTEHMSKMEKAFLSENPESMVDTEAVTGGPYSYTKARVQESAALYMAMGNNVLNPLKPALRKLLSYMANAWYQDESIQSLEAVERKLEDINRRTTKNKFGDSDAQFIWKKIQKYRQELADARSVQRFAKEFAESRKPTYDRNSESPYYLPEYHTSKSFRRDLDDFTSVDLGKLSRLKIQVLQQGIIDLITGISPKQPVYNMVNKLKAEEMLEALLPATGKFAKNPGVFIPKKLTVSLLANPATYSTIMAKYDKKNAQLLFNTIYGGMLKARTDSQMESSDFLEKLFDIANDKKERLQHSDFVRVGMYGAAFSTQLSPAHPEYWTEVEYNLSSIVRNAHNKLEAFDDETYTDLSKVALQDELKIAQNLLTRIMSGKTMNGILSPGQQKLYNTFREFAATYENDMMRNTQGVWGGKFQKQHNYFPTFALGKVSSGSIVDDDLIPNQHVNNLWEGLQQNKNYGKVVARQSGFTKDKVQPEGYFYDYDAISVAHKFAPGMLFDLYASRELKTLNQLLNGAQGHPVKIKGKSLKHVMSQPAVDGLNRQIKSIVGTTTLRDADIAKNLKWLQNAKNSVATAMLATTGQFLTQSSSGVAAALVMTPKGFPKALKVLTGFENGVLNFGVMRKFIKDNGLGIQMRDALFERWQTTEDIQKDGLGRHTEGWKINMERIATAALRRGDKFAARLVWFSAYFEAGGTLENPSKEAVLAAERAVGVMQNMSDVSFSAPIIRNNAAAQRILWHMFFAFKSFAINSALNTLYSGKYFFSKAEARQVFLGNMAMAAAYTAVGQFIIRPAYSGLSTVLGEALTGEDGEEPEEKNYSEGEAFAWNFFWGAFLGQALPTVMDNMLRMWVADFAAKRAEAEGEDFDVYKDFPLYAPKDMKDVMSESMGVYGDALVSGVDIGSAGVESMDLLYRGEDIDSQELFFRTLKDAAMFLKHIPFRGDLQKLINNWERQMRAKDRLVKKGGKNNGGQGVETLEFGTEFETPEYEIEIPENPTELPEF